MRDSFAVFVFLHTIALKKKNIFSYLLQALFCENHLAHYSIIYTNKMSLLLNSTTSFNF